VVNRSNWKGPFLEKFFYEKFLNNFYKIFRTNSRNSIILPFLLKKQISVYNGKYFVPFIVTENMVGRKLGEFSFTRLKYIYKKKRKVKKK